MKKIKVIIDESTKKSSKQKIFERMIIADPSFKMNLNESENKLVYKSIMCEGKSENYNIITETAINDKMLTGNIKKDKVFINQCDRLIESNNIDEFNLYVYKHILKEDIDIESVMDNLSDVCVLSFKAGNSKLHGSVGVFSLPAGWTCPFAQNCLKKVSRDVNPETGKADVTRGKDSEYDCFAASQELQYPDVRMSRWRNFDLLKACDTKEEQVDLILRSLDHFLKSEPNIKYFRIHESGDFYNLEYMDAWFEVAKQRPDLHFYAYTKSNPYIQNLMSKYDSLDNFAITLSKGGRADDNLENLDIKQADVYMTPEELYDAGKLVDLDDNLAMVKGGRDSDFGLLLHGTQKGGSEEAKYKLRNETFENYWKHKKELNTLFKLPEDYVISSKEAGDIKAKLEKMYEDGKIKKGRFQELRKQMNYIIKYHKYNFDPKLSAIIQDKYK
jgi:hypothetical protein